METQPANQVSPRAMELLDRVVRYDDLDKGFVMRAGCPEIAKLIRKVIKHGVAQNQVDEDAQMAIDEAELEQEPIPEAVEVIPNEDETEEERRKREKHERKIKKREKKEREARRRERLEELKQQRQAQREREQSFELISLLPARQLYGVKLQTTVYLATMVDLPCILEAMKTLDTYNYFKSQDGSQMLYIHPSPKIEDYCNRSKDEVLKVANEFWAVRDDRVFLQNLYQREKLAKTMEEHINAGKQDYPFENTSLKFRHGISSAAYNVRNIRYKQKAKFDVSQVQRVERTLKDLIEYGFAEHVDEELLQFDDQGRLINVVAGGRTLGRDGFGSDLAGSVGGGGGGGRSNMDDDGEDYGSDMVSSVPEDDSSCSYMGPGPQSMRSRSLVRGSEVASELGGGGGRIPMDDAPGLEPQGSQADDNQIPNFLKVGQSAGQHSPMITEQMRPNPSNQGMSQAILITDSENASPQKPADLSSQHDTHQFDGGHLEEILDLDQQALGGMMVDEKVEIQSEKLHEGRINLVEIPPELLESKLLEAKQQKEELRKIIVECQRTVTRLERQGLGIEAQEKRKTLSELLKASEISKRRIKQFKDAIAKSRQ